MWTVDDLQYEDFFPDCMLPDCPRSKTEGRHAHVLDHQAIIMANTTKYLYCQGGVGSAKSVAFAARCVDLSLIVPKNKGVVCRLNYDDLYDSSWRDINACIERLADRDLIPEPKFTKKVQGEYTEITLHNRSQLKAIQGKNWQRGLGASHGWFWVDDAMECQEELFTGTETSAGLVSRLRLPEATFHRGSDGQVRNMLSGMVSSNPPPHNHWLHKLFGAQPGLTSIGNDTVEHLRVETFLNPFVGDDYAKGLMSIQQKMGHNSDTARRVIFGESIPSYGGMKVYPQFKHEKHVGEFTFDPLLPLIRSWDFGSHHPAVVFSNLLKCDHGKNHFITLNEISQLLGSAINGVTVYDVWKEVKRYMSLFFSDAQKVFDAGDKSGYRQSTNRQDKRGDIRVLQAEFGLAFKFKYFDLDNSIKYCRTLLNEICKCGMPIIQIDKKAEVLIEALEGGYKYSKSRQGIISDKPIKDKYYDDVADAWRYGLENYVRHGLTYRDEFNPTYKKHKAHKPWDWMEMSDADIAEAIMR